MKFCDKRRYGEGVVGDETAKPNPVATMNTSIRTAKLLTTLFELVFKVAPNVIARGKLVIQNTVIGETM